MHQQEKYRTSGLGRTTVVLHWWVAVGVMGLLGVGVVMSQFALRPLYPLHKSVGILMGVPIVCRIVWRIHSGWPPVLLTQALWERRLARGVHVLLLAGTLFMPLSGMTLSAMSGHGLAVFGVSLFPAHPHPTQAGRVVPLNRSVTRMASRVHFYVGYSMLGLLLLHMAGAFKHHYKDKDVTLTRMLGQ